MQHCHVLDHRASQDVLLNADLGSNFCRRYIGRVPEQSSTMVRMSVVVYMVRSYSSHVRVVHIWDLLQLFHAWHVAVYQQDCSARHTWRPCDAHFKSGKKIIPNLF